MGVENLGNSSHVIGCDKFFRSNCHNEDKEKVTKTKEYERRRNQIKGDPKSKPGYTIFYKLVFVECSELCNLSIADPYLRKSNEEENWIQKIIKYRLGSIINNLIEIAALIYLLWENRSEASN